MEKTTLPEISNWIKSNNKSKFHIFSFADLLEKSEILKILKKFVEKHSNYYIRKEEERIVLVKKECQTT
jgi:dihydroorotase